MNKEQLIIRATELGIQDAGSLTVDQLKAAIKAAEQRLELNSKALKLGIETPEKFDFDELSQLILATESTVLSSRVAVFTSVLGLEGTEELSVEELEAAVKEKVESKATLLTTIVTGLTSVLGLEGIEGLTAEEFEAAVKEKVSSLTFVEKPEAKVKVLKEEGKDQTPFKVKSGNSYQFNENAPAAFRYAGVLKTQKEWLKDSDSLELMVVGNLSYVSLVNNKK